MNRFVPAALAAASTVLAVGCSGHHAAAPASHASARATFDPAVASPDGRQIAVVRHVGTVGSLEVRAAGHGRTKTLYASRDNCCTDVAWASPREIVFVSDFNVWGVDWKSGRVKNLAGFTDFQLSPDRRWLVGWKDAGPHVLETVGVRSIDGERCLLVPKPANKSDSLGFFSRDGKRVFFNREDGSPPFAGRTESVAFTSLRRAPKSAC